MSASTSPAHPHRMHIQEKDKQQHDTECSLHESQRKGGCVDKRMSLGIAMNAGGDAKKRWTEPREARPKEAGALDHIDGLAARFGRVGHENFAQQALGNARTRGATGDSVHHRARLGIDGHVDHDVHL
nr:hypothetical protein [Pandoravirus massiliensis]